MIKPLNSCEWNFPTATAIITLKRGAAAIRIDDAGQLLVQHEGKTPGAGLLLNISSPAFFFHPVPLVFQDSTGRNYQILVPFNTQLTLVVHPSFYHVSNASSVALSQNTSAKIPLLVATGQQVSPVKFTISGVGN